MPKTQLLVDELGKVKAKIADLEEMEACLRQKLIDAGIEEAEGKLFRCTVSSYVKTTTNWKGVVKHLKIQPRTLKKFQTSEDVTVVKIVSR